MNNIISLATGFQKSVNIGYDINSNDKLKSFIPTKSAIELIKDLLLSTNKDSTDRARVLIGAYGKGKSHIVLTALSLLLRKDISLFERLLPQIENNPELKQILNNYYESGNKMLPVVITGSNTSLTQAFLLALQRTLSAHNMLDIMPETNYKAAVQVIYRWAEKYPETYAKFLEIIATPVVDFIDRLENFDIHAYEIFELAYPKLTAGGIFNPFLGFDVVELYESVVVSLKEKGYTGIYVIYDEFSKYLEANIRAASVSDVKMLQDFAEKCNRSGNHQLHLMLICHKEISNYIDKLPQQKVDGWRGVSERFTHVHLNNNFSQTYEIISNVIQKNNDSWSVFYNDHENDFNVIKQRYEKHAIFKENSTDLETAIIGCYPLHPVSTFILPRLSEKVAQNERTLFTFLSASGSATLSAYLEDNDISQFKLLTPDVIYDYFEPLFQKEAFETLAHKQYVLTRAILDRLIPGTLVTKIVKTLSLIYMLEQFERLVPTIEEIVGIYSNSYAVEDIRKAIDCLIKKEYVIYLKTSNGFLRLKKTSGVDIQQKIADLVELQGARVTLKEVLNSVNIDNYMYPSRYNDTYEMTRFFAFEFIGSEEVKDDTDWNIKSKEINADGVMYAILPKDEEDIERVLNSLNNTSKNVDGCVFIIPKHYKDIEPTVRKFYAVSNLKDLAVDDNILFEEYEVVYEDLQEIIKEFLNTYTRPESGLATYLYNGTVRNIRRKGMLSSLLSDICEQAYYNAPVVSNEAVNKDEITNVAQNSRSKIVAALLRNELEPNLGLSGSGQEVSIMRSTLVRTGVLKDLDTKPAISLKTGNKGIDKVLEKIEGFILDAKHIDSVSFANLYESLTLQKDAIGMRKGLIPLFLAAVMHEYKQRIIVNDRMGQVPLTSDLLVQINVAPQEFSLSFIDWDAEKEEYIEKLKDIFGDYIVDAEVKNNSYDFVAAAMRRWYMSLPRFSKEYRGKKIAKVYSDIIGFIKLTTSSTYELLFKKIPSVVGDSRLNEVVKVIRDTKDSYDKLLPELKESLCEKIKEELALRNNACNINKMSLTSVCLEWCETLDYRTFEQVFPNGTEKYLRIIKNATNDEHLLVSKVAKLCTGLRVEDWDRNTIDQFIESLKIYKETAESFHAKQVEQAEVETTSSFEVSYLDENGQSVTKRFDSVDYSPRAKLLKNQITNSLSAMGRAVTEQEKRQVLMEVLQDLL